MAAKPILTSEECLHTSSERSAKNVLQSGVLRGTINEGTPDARSVVIDLHKARGRFVVDANSSSIGHPHRSEHGYYHGGWWWWYSPWWWWWWVAEGANVSIEGTDGTAETVAPLNGRVRVGLREDKSTNDDDASPRFEIGAIEVVIANNTLPLRVTSIVMMGRGEEVAVQQTIGRNWDAIADGERYPRTIDTANTRTASAVFSLLRKWSDAPQDMAVVKILPQGQVATKWALTLARASITSYIYEVFITLGGADPQIAFSDRKLYSILTLERIKALEDVLMVHGELTLFGASLSMTAGTGDGQKALDLLDALSASDDRIYTHRAGLDGWDLELRGAPPMVKPVRTGRVIPRLHRKREKASDSASWTLYNLEDLDNTTVFVSVQKEDRDKHPWAGLGDSDKKFALSYMPEDRLLTPDTQGVKLLVTEGTRYDFDGARVPTNHPFYITKSPSGGSGDKKQEGAETGDLLTKKSKMDGTGRPTIGWVPRIKSGHAKWSHYYQCSKHRFMGGHINISPRTRTTMMQADAGVLVQYDSHTDSVVVVRDDEDERVFNFLNDALEHLGMSITSKPLFYVGSGIDKHTNELSIARVTVDDAEEDEDENCVPAVLMRSGNALYCNHVHSVASIKAWLQEDMPEGSKQMCPKCM